MTDQPLHEYIDLEAYDVVPGPQYRKLLEQLEAQQEHIRRAQACLDDALALSNPATNPQPSGKATLTDYPDGESREIDVEFTPVPDPASSPKENA